MGLLICLFLYSWEARANLPQVQVTEHRVERKFCEHCQEKKMSQFPLSVKTDTQYGHLFKSWVIYFMNYQLQQEGRMGRSSQVLAPKGTRQHRAMETQKPGVPCRRN